MSDESFIQPKRDPHDLLRGSSMYGGVAAMQQQSKPRRVGRTVLWLATMGVLGFIATVLWCWLAYRTGMAVDQWLFQR